MIYWKAFLSFLFVAMFIGGSVAIRCFQCSASSPFSKCQSDVDLLLEAKTNGGSFSKNCSIETNQHYCMIEQSQSKGLLTTFVRDCTDGETFSFDIITRLHNLSPTNQTTCGTFGTSGTIVCISICRTDFCNGPQSTSGTTTTTTRAEMHRYFIVLLFITKVLFQTI